MKQPTHTERHTVPVNFPDIGEERSEMEVKVQGRGRWRVIGRLQDPEIVILLSLGFFTIVVRVGSLLFILGFITVVTVFFSTEPQFL